MKMNIQEDGVFYNYDSVISIRIKDEKLTFNYIDSKGKERLVNWALRENGPIDLVVQR